jgi:hypothetical protein
MLPILFSRRHPAMLAFATHSTASLPPSMFRDSATFLPRKAKFASRRLAEACCPIFTARCTSIFPQQTMANRTSFEKFSLYKRIPCCRTNCPLNSFEAISKRVVSSNSNVHGPRPIENLGS